MNQSKVINSWCMYDWANSVYSLVITSTIFPIYFTNITMSSSGSDRVLFFNFSITNSALYSYSLSFSFLLVSIILPFLSSLADYSRVKKFFMKIFMFIGSISCLGMYFFDNVDSIEWGILCLVFAGIGFSGSLVFYDAFLPEIVTKDKYDKVSAKGYSFGYIGSVILLLINLLMIEKYDSFGFVDKLHATRFSFVTVACWWFVFSQVTFYYLPKEKIIFNIDKKNLLNSYRQLIITFNNFKYNKVAGLFLLSYFFYNMGVQTVMYLAAIFGSKELNLEDHHLIITILIIQLVAIGGAYFFAYVSETKGNKFSLIIMLIVWILICVGAYYVYSVQEFYILAVVVGLVMGGIQSLSRATYAKLIPLNFNKSASFFSFYDVIYNISIVLGTFIYGLLNQITNNMRVGILVLILFFLIGLIILLLIKIPKSFIAQNR